MGKETIRRFSEDYPEDRETLSSIGNRAIRAIHAFDRLNRGTGRTATCMGDGGRACRDARRAYLAWCGLLNYRRAVADGIEPPPRGEYMGDGIARNAGGEPYEPLEPYPQQYRGPDMSGMQISREVTYDRLGMTLTQPGLLKADVNMEGITIGIGYDPLTRREFALTEGEAIRLADWIYSRTRGVSRLG